jgi:hypothetical protein
VGSFKGVWLKIDFQWSRVWEVEFEHFQTDRQIRKAENSLRNPLRIPVKFLAKLLQA